jgi:hypothetical protein
MEVVYGYWIRKTFGSNTDEISYTTTGIHMLPLTEYRPKRKLQIQKIVRHVRDCEEN